MKEQGEKWVVRDAIFDETIVFVFLKELTPFFKEGQKNNKIVTVVTDKDYTMM